MFEKWWRPKIEKKKHQILSPRISTSQDSSGGLEFLDAHGRGSDVDLFFVFFETRWSGDRYTTGDEVDGPHLKKNISIYVQLDSVAPGRSFFRYERWTRWLETQIDSFPDNLNLFFFGKEPKPEWVGSLWSQNGTNNLGVRNIMGHWSQNSGSYLHLPPELS